MAVYTDASNRYHGEDDWSFGYAYRLGWLAVTCALVALAMAMLFPADRLLGRARVCDSLGRSSRTAPGATVPTHASLQDKDFEPAFPSVPWPALISNGATVHKGASNNYPTYLKEKRAQAGGVPRYGSIKRHCPCHLARSCVLLFGSDCYAPHLLSILRDIRVH
jgi:hypothetical protein